MEKKKKFHNGTADGQFYPYILRVLVEASLDEVLERLRITPGELWRIVFGDEEEDAHRVELGVWRFTFGELNCGDAERPNVGLRVVHRLLYHLWRHPERRTDEGVALRRGVGELAGDAEVCELHVAHLAEQHVGGFDVAVELPLGVQIVEALQHLPQDDGDVHLLEESSLHQVQRRPAAKVLHDDPQLRSFQIRAEVLGDERRVALR